jgi:hypothetical protein
MAIPLITQVSIKSDANAKVRYSVALSHLNLIYDTDDVIE